MGVVIKGHWLLQDPLVNGYSALEAYLPSQRIARSPLLAARRGLSVGVEASAIAARFRRASARGRSAPPAPRESRGYGPRHMAVSLAAYALIAGQEATRYWLSRQRWNRATLLTTTAYGSRAVISA
jgi:hypothetical protein